MSRATLAVEGSLPQDPRSGRSANGDAFLSFSVPHQASRRNKQTGAWENVGETLWVAVTLWREDAERYAPLLSKGTLVHVEGVPKLRTWEKDGRAGANLEVGFPSVSLFPRRAAGAAQSAQPAEPEAWHAPDDQEPW